ncbi:phage tail tape measure protein [Oricola indica]|jgi:TP901 family phage tail tape measure protein|uniref:phage tail tape measure protein n=1 Tax=Oricola indica TaxID=2872591 RepID=UPI001CBD6C5B|nr:phage tail tape measure protein [Oricola indica]
MATLTSELILSLVDRVTAPARAVAGSLERMQAAQRRNAERMNATRLKMVDATAAAFALARAISAPTRAAMAFESAMADVNKVVDFEAPDGLQQMSKDILTMSRRIPMAATGIADIVAAAGQAGMKGGELLEFAEIAAKVGVAFDISAGYAGESLAKIKTALGLTVADTAALADAINHLSNTSASAAPDLLDFMRRVGSVGIQYGFTAEQTAAIGSAMIAAGQTADVSATSFRNVGRALSRGASATKSQNRAFKQLGLDAKQVAKDLQEDAVGTLQDVVARIRKLPEHLRAAAISDLFGDEARAIMPLIENSDLLAQSLGAVAEKANFLGSSQAEYEVRAKTSANAMQLFRNQMEALSISIGSALLPALVQVTATVGPMIAALGDFAAAHPEVTAAVTGLVASLVGLRIATLAARYAFLFLQGGILDAGIAAAKGAGMIVAAAKRIKLAIAAATVLSSVGGGGMFVSLVAGIGSASTAIVGSAGAIVAAIAGITAPIWGVIAAVAALALAIYNYWEPISNFVSGFAEAILGALGPVVDAIAGFGGRIAAAVGEWATQRAVDLAAILGIDEASVRAAIAAAQAEIGALARSVVDIVTAIPSQIGNWVSDLFSINDYSDEAEASFRDAGRQVGQALVDGVIGAVTALIEWFRSLPQRILEAIGRIDIASLIKWPQPPAWLSRLWGGEAKVSAPEVDGARAAGGAIAGGRTYLVGEHGPELVTPSRAGYVHSAASMSGAQQRAGLVIEELNLGPITIHEASDAQRIAEELGRKLRDALSGVQADMEWAVS